MQQTPRERNGKIFIREELLISIVQGIIIAAGALIFVLLFYEQQCQPGTKMIVFTTLILSNIFLTFTNRSSTKTIYNKSRYIFIPALVIVIIPAFFLATLHFVSFVRNLIQLAIIT